MVLGAVLAARTSPLVQVDAVLCRREVLHCLAKSAKKLFIRHILLVIRGSTGE